MTTKLNSNIKFPQVPKISALIKVFSPSFIVSGVNSLAKIKKKII